MENESLPMELIVGFTDITELLIIGDIKIQTIPIKPITFQILEVQWHPIGGINPRHQ